MIWLNKNDNKKQTSRSFSILFSVMESLEIVMGILRYFTIFVVFYLEIVENIDQLYKVLFLRGVSESIDRQGCAILALEVVPKNLIFT